MADSEVRNYELSSDEEELSESNRRIWKLLGLKLGDVALFFPAPNALIPIMFAKFMNKRKVTFVDTNEISVSTLIKLAAQMKLSNVTVKLASPQGKFPVPDSAFDLSFCDWGLSYFSTGSTNRQNDAEVLTKELVRVTKPGGKIASLEENGAPVMYPCPTEILSIRSKIESSRSEKFVMGRRAYSLFKTNNLKGISLYGFSDFLTGEKMERMRAEINRRISNLETGRDTAVTSGVTVQELERYVSWLRAQTANQSFLMQFNSILTIGEK